MDAHAKMGSGNTTGSRSVDISDLPFSQLCNPAPNPVENPEIIKTQKLNPGEENGGKGGERFGVFLRRNSSVSSAAASRRFRPETQSNAATGKAFSLRRSSSVGEGYCRIHDQTEMLSPPLENPKGRSRSGKGRPRFLEACKKLFRFT